VAAPEVPRAALHPLSAARALLALALAAAAAGCRECTYYATGVKRAEGERSLFDGEREGVWTFYYETGEPRERGRYEDGKREGRWEQWLYNGQKYSEGMRHWNPETRASERIGPWTFWHTEGALRAEGAYRLAGRAGARPHGTWRTWHSNGLLASEGAYALGERDGPWRTWHENGRLASEGAYARGRREGEWRYYTKDGAVDAEQSGAYSADARVDAAPGAGAR
jgi:antitoxin component YwqK of YwqJK toxin-antitoxin module